MIAQQRSLLDLPISFFEYDHEREAFANVPSQQTTLRRMIRTHYYRDSIEAIRAETEKANQDELKKYLPAFTPVALLNHRKRNTSFAEKIIQQHPLIMGDIDLKDNPDIDMSELKQYISRVPYILLCSYSVRGGLWFVVRLPDNQNPQSLAAHFRYLQKVFREKFGIILDASKGGNPAHLRFVSYDTDPYFNETPSVMSGTYTPPPPKPVSYCPDNRNTDDSQLLSQIAKIIEKAADGERHISLLKAARVAGGYVGAGRLDEETATLTLETLASNWPNFTKSQKTIRDGIHNGKYAPIYDTQTTGNSYSQSTPKQTPHPKPTLSIWDNPPIEYIPVPEIDELTDYPKEWDIQTGAKPSCRLIPSPNRFYYAEKTGVSPDRVYSLANFQ
jgi:hypothetical protein